MRCRILPSWSHRHHTDTSLPERKKRSKNAGCHGSDWHLLVCKLPGEQGLCTLLCSVLAPHRRMFDTRGRCDVSYLGICVSCVPRTPVRWLMFDDVLLFLSQRCASSTSHRRDRRKRLLGCWMPGPRVWEPTWRFSDAGRR